jgi:hypothetical protein
MNSPLQHRKVRLRGLGGQALCGVPCTCASATGDLSNQFLNGHNLRQQAHEIRLRGLEDAARAESAVHARIVEYRKR